MSSFLLPCGVFPGHGLFWRFPGWGASAPRQPPFAVGMALIAWHGPCFNATLKGMRVTGDRRTRIHWVVFLALILFVKGVLVLLDHRPMLFLGDSASHIRTAVHGTIPADRSFTYGFLIKQVALRARSLDSLVVFQAFLGAFNSMLLAFLLLEHFRVRQTTAFVMGLLNAVEPLQLMYERYVLTETVALFVFVCYVAMVFRYIARPRLSVLALVQLMAVLLVSFRISFFAMVCGGAVVIPLLAVSGVRGRSGRQTAMHVMASLVLLALPMAGYRCLNGKLSSRSPAMQYASGRFLLAGVAPIVTPQDFPRADLRGAVFGGVTNDLRDRTRREDHRWHAGGLVRSMEQVIPDEAEVDGLSRHTAIHAMRRDPAGVLKLVLLAYTDHFRIGYLKTCMRKDRGIHTPRPWLMNILRREFRYAHDAVPGVCVRSVTGFFFLHASLWYCLLALFPWLALVALRIVPRESARHIFVLFILSVLILVPVVLFGPHPVARYLHTFAWMLLFVAGVAVDGARGARLSFL